MRSRSRRWSALILALLSLATLLGFLVFRQTEDERLLQEMLRDFLFDPQGAERVRITLEQKSWYDKPEKVTREGWLVRDNAGDRIFFTDGDSIPAPPEEKITKVDFIARCKLLYAQEPREERDDRFILLRMLDRLRGVEAVPVWRRSKFPLMNGMKLTPSSRNSGEEADLVLAAWLLRLGERAQAARVMRFVQQDRVDELGIVRKCLAYDAMERMYRSFMDYQDEAALAHGERMLRLYPPEAEQYDHAGLLVEDLRRRKSQGTLNKKGDKSLPQQYARWDTKKRAAFLIDTLESIDAHSGYCQRVPHVAALIQLGEPAVPDLLDALARDERMTRGVQFPGKYQDLRGISVREILLAALKKILRVRCLNPRADEEGKWWLSIPELRISAEVARAYWREYGHLPYEDRLMRVIKDSQTTREAQREACENLSGDPEPREGKPWPREVWPYHVKEGSPNLTVMRFEGPTAAEAVLCAMDRDLAHLDAQPTNKSFHFRSSLENSYFYSLIRIGDRRIASELARRASNEPATRMRLYWAYASHRLGDSQPLRQFVNDFASGKISVSVDPEEARNDLERIVGCFATEPIPEATRTLYELAEVQHPFHIASIQGLLRGNHRVFADKDQCYLTHPSGVSLLRSILEDKTPTDAKTEVVGDALHEYSPGSHSSRGVPLILKDPAKRKASAVIRNCDLAARILSDLVVGLPESHPLLIDVDDHLVTLKKTLDHFASHYRRLSAPEQKVLWDRRFAPDLYPLGRPATAEDVRAGRTIFHFGGKGQLAELRLPAQATWKKGLEEKEARRGLIVQAEVGPDGETVYGIIEWNAIRTVPARELASVTPLSEVNPNQKD
jgi:hypothetical protein